MYTIGSNLICKSQVWVSLSIRKGLRNIFESIKCSAELPKQFIQTTTKGLGINSSCSLFFHLFFYAASRIIIESQLGWPQWVGPSKAAWQMFWQPLLLLHQFSMQTSGKILFLFGNSSESWPLSKCKLEVKGMAPIQESTYSYKGTWNNWGVQLAPTDFLSGWRMKRVALIIQQSNGYSRMHVNIAAPLEPVSHWRGALCIYTSSMSFPFLLLPVYNSILWPHKHVIATELVTIFKR